MSINHHSSDFSQPPHWWVHPNNLCYAAADGRFDLNNGDEEVVERAAEIVWQEAGDGAERLFEKPLTPSDVGKLNRLVIPKQQAEKHFPLSDGEAVENGLLLGFEDEAGKSWRFRYSYWNSSQSYVLTKGWSRFVKEKRLDAGDIVVFSRHRVDAGRLFIRCKRRCAAEAENVQPRTEAEYCTLGWNPRVFYPGQYAYPTQHIQPGLSYPHHHQSIPSVGRERQTTTSSGNSNSRRLRLFGVNLVLECHPQAQDSDPTGSPMSAQDRTHQYPRGPYHNPPLPQFYYSDLSFSGADVYRQG